MTGADDASRAEPQLGEGPCVSERDILADAAPFAIVAVDDARVVRSWNPAATRAFGWPAQDILGKRLPEATAGTSDTLGNRPSDAPDAPAAEVNLALRCWDGSISRVRAQVATTRDRDGRPLAALYVQSPEHETLDTRRFRDFARMSADWFWETDLDQTYTFIAASAGDGPFPRPISEYQGVSRWDLLRECGASTEAARRIDAAIRRREPFFDLEYEHAARPDGRRTVVQTSGEPIRDEDGRCIGYRGVARDITADRDVECDMRARGEFIEAIARSAPGVLYQWRPTPDGRGAMTYVSEKSRDLFGIAPETLTRDIRSLVPAAEESRALDASIAAALHEDAPWFYEGRYVHGESGQTRIWRGISNPARDGRGERVWNGIMLDVTDERRAETDLRAREAMLSHAARMARLGHWVFNLETGELEHASPETCRILGCSLDERRRLTRSRAGRLGMIHPADRKAYDEDVERPRAQGRPYVARYRTLLPDGGERHCVEMGDPVVDDAGRTIRIVGTLQDVTAVHETEAAAQTSERRYRAIAEMTSQLHLMVERRGARGWRTAWSAGGLEGFLDLPPDDADPLAAIIRAVHPETARSARRAAAKALRGRSVDEEIKLSRAADGQEIWARLYARPEVEPLQGRVHWVHVAIQDVTASKKADQKLRRREERLRRVTENLPGAVLEYEIAPDGSLQFGLIRGGLADVLEIERGAPAADWTARANAADLKALIAASREAAAAGAAVDMTIRFASDGGARLVARLIARPRAHPGPAGGAAFDGVLVDITRQKEAEERLARNEIQLRQAQKMESLGTLAGGIAHDFNNALQPMIALSELLRDTHAPDSEVHDCASAIAESGGRAKELVQQLLAFARADHGPGLEPMDLSQVVRDAVRMIERTIPSTVEVKTEIGPTAPVATSQTLIYQILLNLVTNSVHAIPGHGHIRIALEEAPAENPDDPAPRARLTVEDNGSGIPQGAVGRVFDPFFTTKDVGEGTGLGLSVVHGIVESHGGTIAVESWPDTGTRFTLHFPAAADV